MKKFFLFIILILFSYTLFSQCSYNIVVGSSVGIPNIQTAINQNVLQLNSSGYVSNNFCISGDFDISNRIFSQCSIKLINNSSKIKVTSGQTTELNGCFVIGAGGNSQIITSSNTALLAINSEFQSISDIELNGSLGNWGSKYYLIGNISVYNCGIYNDECYFEKAQIRVYSGGAIISSGDNTYTTRCKSNFGSCMPVQLYSGSYYIGINDYFFNSHNGILCEGCKFINVKGSTFHENSIGIFLRNATQLENLIQGCTISGINTNSNNLTGISSYKTNNLKIISNDISLENYGLGCSIELGNNHEVINNVINDCSFRYKDVVNSKFNNNSEVAIATFFNSNLVEIVNNQFEPRWFSALDIYSTDNVIAHSNLVSSGGLNTVGAEIVTGDFHFYSCNDFSGLENGMTVRGDPYSEFELLDNNFNGGQTGLTFKSYIGPTLIPPCINKGNKFQEYSQFGLVYEEYPVTDPFVFKVGNIPAEYPNHSPWNVMVNTGVAHACGDPINGLEGNPDPNKCFGEFFLYKINLVKKLLECYNPEAPTNGYCHTQIKRALEILKRCPNLLSDPVIYQKYLQLRYSDFSKFPIFKQLDSELTLNFVPLNYDINDIISMFSMEKLQDLIEQIEVKNSSDEELRADYIELINQKINEYQGVSVVETTVTNYKKMLLAYLDLKREVLINQSRQQEIITIAEDCLEKEGPAGDLAKYLCRHLGLTYFEDNCISPREKKNELEAEEIIIAPNPVADFLEIKTISNFKSTPYSIYNSLGMEVEKSEIFYYDQINVSALNAGVYFLQVGTMKPIKFVKI